MVADRRTKAQLVVGLAFLLGALTGGLAVRLFYGQQSQAPTTVVEVVNELTTKVGLDNEQRTQVTEILSESRKQRRELYDQMRPQFTAVRDTARAKVRTLLKTKEQQDKYDQWLKELDAKRAQQQAREDAANKTTTGTSPASK